MPQQMMRNNSMESINSSIHNDIDERTTQEKDLDLYAYQPPLEPTNFEEDDGGLTCWQKFRFFIKQAWKDIGRHKCQFCLSFCSVFVVVLSVLVVVSITELGPIIFLRLSEKSNGDYDGILSSRQELVAMLELEAEANRRGTVEAVLRRSLTESEGGASSMAVFSFLTVAAIALGVILGKYFLRERQSQKKSELISSLSMSQIARQSRNSSMR